MSQESTHHPAPARPNPSTSDGHPAQLRPGPFGPIPALPDEVSEHWPETSDPEQQTGSTSAREVPAAETAALRLRAWMSRPEHGFDLLRVYLGVGLLVRGALFARNPALLDQFINSDDWLFPMFLAHSLVLAHVVGGLLLSLGCCTRFAAAMQIPFVAGALFLVHWDEGLLATTQSFEFAALVLVALAVYAVCGAGRLSVDNWMQRTPPEVATGEPALGLQREILDRHASTSRESELVLASPQASALLGDALPKDPPYAREEYRDVKHELVIVLVSMGVLFVLLARGLYLLAPVWLIATLVVFVVWRVGQAPLD